MLYSFNAVLITILRGRNYDEYFINKKQVSKRLSNLL